jgi:5S rRNA maturation endonuclease (ribonuclease M5)
MNKREMAEELARLIAEGPDDEARLVRHHMTRPTAAVRESLLRQRAIARVSRAEMDRHCQFAGLPKL